MAALKSEMAEEANTQDTPNTQPSETPEVTETADTSQGLAFDSVSEADLLPDTGTLLDGFKFDISHQENDRIVDELEQILKTIVDAGAEWLRVDAACKHCAFFLVMLCCWHTIF